MKRLAILFLVTTTAHGQPVVLDAENNLLGDYLGTNTNFVVENAVSRMGYKFSFDRMNGTLRQVAPTSMVGYESQDCSGRILAPRYYSPGYVTPTYPFSDRENPAPLVYVAQNPVAVDSALVNSHRDADGVCIMAGVGTQNFYETHANDPAITGVEAAVFPRPAKGVDSSSIK